MLPYHVEIVDAKKLNSSELELAIKIENSPVSQIFHVKTNHFSRPYRWIDSEFSFLESFSSREALKSSIGLAIDNDRSGKIAKAVLG